MLMWRQPHPEPAQVADGRAGGCQPLKCCKPDQDPTSSSCPAMSWQAAMPEAVLILDLQYSDGPVTSICKEDVARPGKEFRLYGHEKLRLESRPTVAVRS